MTSPSVDDEPLIEPEPIEPVEEDIPLDERPERPARRELLLLFDEVPVVDWLPIVSVEPDMVPVLLPVD